MTGTDKTKLDSVDADAEENDANTTLKGNAFNGNSQLVELEADGKLPAIDGSQLTGLSSGFTDPMTTIGDVIIRDGTNTTVRLGVGTTGQVIGSDDGVNVGWVDSTALTTTLDSTEIANVTAVDVQTGMVQMGHNHESLVDTVGKLDSAQGDLNFSGTFGITTSTQKLTFDVQQQSSNTDVFEIDDGNDELIFKVAGNYTIMSTVTFHSNTSASRTVTVSTNNVTGDAPFSSRDIVLSLGNNATSQPIVLNTLIIITEEQVGTPIYLDINVIADDTGIDLLHYDSVITVNQTSAQSYSLPVATDAVLGGVKQGTGVSIDVDGVLSATGGSPLAVVSDVDGVAGSDRVVNMISLTRAEYDLIIPDASTYYIIEDSSGSPVYATLDSPTFTGVPKTSAPSNGDSSTRIATTQFVKDNAVGSDISVATGAGLITDCISISQANYDAIGTKSATTIYYITD